jgi:hypothetical protein
MAENFHDRLRDYYMEVARVLKGQADSASIFPNPTDKGMSREEVYSTFLKQHVPSKCNVVFGGFLFHQDGRESRQVDIIVTCDVAPRFNLFQKTFSPVEGTLCVVSVKSNLTGAEIDDALDGFASIPPTQPLGNRASPLFPIEDYDDWPLKVVYASMGSSPDTLHKRLTRFYDLNPHIPLTRRPHFIHVSGSCLLARVVTGFKVVGPEGTELPVGDYFRVEGPKMDAGAIAWVLSDIQKLASISTQIHFRYGELTDHVMAKV